MVLVSFIHVRELHHNIQVDVRVFEQYLNDRIVILQNGISKWRETIKHLSIDVDIWQGQARGPHCILVILSQCCKEKFRTRKVYILTSSA